MTDLILQGICGRMGRTLLEIIAARTDCRVVAGIDQQRCQRRGHQSGTTGQQSHAHILHGACVDE